MGNMKLIIYGINLQAQQLKYYLEMEDAAEVIGFAVDSKYKNSETLLGLPVISYEALPKIYSPEVVQIVLSFGYKNMVKNREEKFLNCKRAGYSLFTYISKFANVFTDDIGEGSLIYPGSTIAPFVSIGKGNFFEIGVSIAHHTKIGDFNFFAPSATVCGATEIGRHCFFGAHSTVINALKIEDETLVGAGATVTKNTGFSDVYFPGRSPRGEMKSGAISI